MVTRIGSMFSFSLRTIFSPRTALSGTKLGMTVLRQPPSVICACGLRNESRPSFSSKAFQQQLEDKHKLFSTSQAVQFVEDDSNPTDIIEKVNSQITDRDMGRLFAVVHFTSLQRKVTEGDLVAFYSHVDADIGEKIRLNKVMLVGGKDFTLIGRPLLSSELVRVEATVIEKTLEHTKIHFWYIRRKGYKKLRPMKKLVTVLRITKIEVGPVQDH